LFFRGPSLIDPHDRRYVEAALRHRFAQRIYLLNTA